jgi:peptidoglycan-associated lipoprotein
MNVRFQATATALFAALVLAGCASKTSLTEAPVESRTPTPATSASGSGSTTPSTGSSAGTTAAPQAESRVATVDAAAAAVAAANAAGRIVYFDFDSFVLKDEFKPLVDAHARALSVNRGKRIMIEGHTDERGGREYNLALGQKRAEAVGRALALLGAQDTQFEAVSFGEERPAEQGSDEAAWAKNRRAEIKDR